MVEITENELAALMKDAQRYRWMRSSFTRAPKHKLEWHLLRTEPLTAEGLDANIDAAMHRQKL